MEFCQACFIVLFLRDEVFSKFCRNLGGKEGWGGGGDKIVQRVRENAVNIERISIERARETSPDDDAEYPVFSGADPRFSEALIRLDTRKRRKWRNVGQGGLEGREPIQFS